MERGLVSMNLWGFTPDALDALAAEWEAHEAAGSDAEFQLPTAVGAILRRGDGTVRVIPTPEAWLGITWPDDRAWVAAQLKRRPLEGRYPSPLWGTP